MLPLRGPPQDLRLGVVWLHEGLADPTRMLGFVQAFGLEQHVREPARRRRQVGALTHLLERLVVAPQLPLGRLEVSGEQLDRPRVDRCERRVEPNTEVLADRPALRGQGAGSFE